ncbi:murein biosynthesis integral membrane protein MurJ [Sporosarcina sp. 179-K 3D1 HS]|uniref:murein biosynthesis integral membrane protein MurJ n=1 Tax=Sporosarcina sp. 179-K 3D1 HS TaxID=3232169 RepID=UPI0039A0038A
MNKFLKIIGAVAVINIVARLFGFLREVAIANEYGATGPANAIFTAYTIPNFIYLVVGGALTTAFISVYHSSKSDKGEYVRKAFGTVLLAAVGITVVLLLLTDPVLHTFFKDMNEEEFTLTRELYLWMMPSTIVLVLSTWMSGLFNINGKFNLSSMAILLYNAAFVGIAVALTSTFGVQAYGIGAFVSALLMGIFLFAGLQKSKFYSLKPSFAMSDDVKRLWVIALPILFGGASLQFYNVIYRIAASPLGGGAISVVNYASKLSAFPQAIMMTAVTTVIYPLLSKKEGEGDDKTVRSLYRKGLLYMVALFLPTTLIAYFFAEPLITLAYGRGEFDHEEIMATTPVFQAFNWSMFFLAATTYVTRFYYAKGNSMTPVIFSLINVFGINLAVIYLMIDSFGATAIAYGTVISAAVNFLMLTAYARWKWKL